MNIYFLKDLSENTVDGVIISEQSSAAEIQNTICSVKTEFNDDWTIDDIVENLPDDCVFYFEPESVYY